MKEPVKNIAASVVARLKNQNEILERPFTEILQYYAMERFLYRLSKTKYADKFILKGGLLLYAWSLPLRRPTRDIDFRGYVSSNRTALATLIKEVIAEPISDDGIIFDLKSISVEDTQMDADYEGVRIKFTASIERSKIPIQIDIGFSDEITAKAEMIEYPSILPNFKKVRIQGYPKESVVAEKFHSMIHHAELNSRLKDYYDLWLISSTFVFELKDLQKAIETTFATRDTEIPNERPIALSVEFANANQTRWENFLSKINLQNNKANNFEMVINKIWNFIRTPLQISSQEKNKKWKPNTGWE